MSNISWTPFVFLRYVVFLISGIIIEIYQPSALSFWLGVNLSTLLVYLLIFKVLPGPKKYIYQGLFGILAFLFLASFGGMVTHFENERNYKSHLTNFEEEIKWYSGRIESEVQSKGNWFRCELKIDKIRTKERWVPAFGRVLIYQPKKDSLKQVEYGDVLLVKGAPILVRAPDHPYDFDYKKYLSYRQIFHQCFLKEYSIIHRGQGNQIFAFSFYLRKKGDLLFKKYVRGERERSLASALILGVRNELDNDLKAAYSRIGVIHVLAVSGMHVALIFQMLLLSLGSIKKIKNGQLFFGILSLSVIWLFAFVTGLSASVLRAVMMFSFILIGQIFSQQKNTYNNIALSAFCLLIYDPFLITDIGFQLSYLAVFGIVYLHPKIYELIEVKNWIGNFFWTTVSITIAAQIATSPLSIFYFHQFPSYFLFSNVIIIPLTSLVLYLGMGILFFFWVPFLPDLLGVVIKKMVWFCNEVVFFTNSLPGAAVTGLEISLFETLLIYLSIALVLILLYTRRFKYLINLCLVVMAFSFSIIFSTITASKNNCILIYRNKRVSDVEFRDYVKRVVYNKTSNNVPAKEVEGMIILVWKGKTILFIDKQSSLTFSEKANKIKIDIMLIRNNSVISLSEFLKVFDVKQVVLDNSNAQKASLKFINNALTLKVPVHSVVDDGAFELNFRH